MKQKIKNWIEYFNVRYSIGTTQRYLAMMTLFSVATVIVTYAERWKNNVYVLLPCVAGMFFYLILYIESRFFYSKYKSYKLYEVKKSTGTIHMRAVDLHHRFHNISEEEAKKYLIEKSYKDFVSILEDYKESNTETRMIQTHKSFVRPFMQALRDLKMVSYVDEELENFFSSAIECDGIDVEKLDFLTLNGYSVVIKYMGCHQNKMIALRMPIFSRCNYYLARFSVAIPYFEIIVKKEGSTTQCH